MLQHILNFPAQCIGPKLGRHWSWRREAGEGQATPKWPRSTTWSQPQAHPHTKPWVQVQVGLKLLERQATASGISGHFLLMSSWEWYLLSFNLSGHSFYNTLLGGFCIAKCWPRARGADILCRNLRLFASRLLSLHFEGNTLECYWRIKFLNCCAFNITCSAFGPAHNVQGIYVNILWAGQTLEN